MAPQDLPPQINPRDWYDTLLYDVERSGLLLLEASIEDNSHTAVLVIRNRDYAVWVDAVAKMTVLADLHLPSSVNTFRFVIEEEGHRVKSVQMRRPSLAYGQNKELVERQISILPAAQAYESQHKTEFCTQNKLFFDVNLATRSQFFDPDDPAALSAVCNVQMDLMLPPSWAAYGLPMVLI